MALSFVYHLAYVFVLSLAVDHSRAGCMNVTTLACVGHAKIVVSMPLCYFQLKKNGVEMVNDSCAAEASFVLEAKKQCDGENQCQYAWSNRKIKECERLNLTTSLKHICLEYGTTEPSSRIEDSNLWIFFLLVAIILFAFVVVNMVLYQNNRGCFYQFCCKRCGM